MAKKIFTDSDIWKKQRWFKRLPKDYKLAFFYIKDMCDVIGIWKIDCVDLMEDTGIDDFDLKDFINSCNTDEDKISGKKKKKERFKMISENELWLTGFVQFQYENKDTKVVSETHVIARSALNKLKARGLYSEAIKHKYLIVNQ